MCDVQVISPPLVQVQTAGRSPIYRLIVTIHASLEQEGDSSLPHAQTGLDLCLDLCLQGPELKRFSISKVIHARKLASQ